MKYTIRWLEESIGDQPVAETQQELEVDVPDHAVRVQEAMVFEALDWSNHPRCARCQSADPCVQLVGVYLSHRTARVVHEYDRSATNTPKPWPPARPEGF